MSDDRYMDKLTMTRTALDALVKAVPDITRPSRGSPFWRKHPSQLIFG
jgi:hypothetical protein